MRLEFTSWIGLLQGLTSTKLTPMMFEDAAFGNRLYRFWMKFAAKKLDLQGWFQCPGRPQNSSKVHNAPFDVHFVLCHYKNLVSSQHCFCQLHPMELVWVWLLQTGVASDALGFLIEIRDPLSGFCVNPHSTNLLKRRVSSLSCWPTGFLGVCATDDNNNWNTHNA